MSCNSVSSENASNLTLLCNDDEDNIEIGMTKDIERFNIKAHNCSASIFSSVAIDEQGRLYKCFEDIGSTEYSFGSASEWDPINPFLTADIPGNLISYLNTPVFSEGEECMKCIFLPVCAGGCPLRKVRYGHRQCVAYKNNPERYALSLYEKAKKREGRFS